MLRNTELTEFKTWYICINLMASSDSQEIMKWLARLERLTETMHDDCLIELKSYYEYYALHCEAN